MGYSQHAGVVIVCDGTDAAAKRIERVLVERPGHRRDAPCRCRLRGRDRLRQGAGAEPADGGALMELQPGRADARRPAGHPCAAAPVASTLDAAARAAIRASAAVVQRAARGDAPVYGVNTGFGKLATTRISESDLDQLQLNLIRSHSVGVGEPLAPPVVRLMLALKAASPGARRLGRARGGGRHAAGRAQRRARAVRAVPGLGRRIGRPGAAGAHDAGR